MGRQNGRQARTARLQVRFREVAIAKPTSNHHADSLPEAVTLYAVEARELAETVPERVPERVPEPVPERVPEPVPERVPEPVPERVPEPVPEREEPIRWRLLTTRSVATFEEAREVIGHYSKRPQIEQVFRLLKQQGFELERSQLESGAALKKLCVLSAEVVLMVMKLMSGRGETRAGAEPASLVFPDEEAQAFMRKLQSELEGATRKQQCSHEAGTLAWASWIVGRLGGWNGYARGSPPARLR